MSKICEIIFPMIANHKTNKKVYEKIQNFDAVQDFEEIKLNLIPIEFLKEKYDDTLKAKDKLEDKAKSNIIGITISITLIMGATSFLSSLYDKVSNQFLVWLIFALFIAVVIYMLFAGLLVIRVLIGENTIYTINSYISEEQEKKETLYLLKEKNEKMNIIRNNHIYSSYECIRNALFCLFVLFLGAIYPIQNVNEHTQENLNSKYTFLFSDETINNFGSNVVRSDVKEVISKVLDNTNNKEKENFSVVNQEKNIFIKFSIVNNEIIVILVEPLDT